MASFEFIKTIEARKLNKRSGLPLNEPAVPIPYSAIVEKEEERWDFVKFKYLGERYQCATPTWQEAARSYGEASAAETAVAEVPASLASPASATPAAAPKDVQVKWEELTSSHQAVLRAKLKGGWLVSVRGSGLAFYPDPKHAWDGRSED
jgi:hypothetical protein